MVLVEPTRAKVAVEDPLGSGNLVVFGTVLIPSGSTVVTDYDWARPVERVP